MVHKLSIAAEGVGMAAYTGERRRRRSSRPGESSTAPRTLAAFEGSSANAEPARWSARRTMAFLFVINCASWIGIATALKAAF